MLNGLNYYDPISRELRDFSSMPKEINGLVPILGVLTQNIHVKN